MINLWLEEVKLLREDINILKKEKELLLATLNAVLQVNNDDITRSIIADALVELGEITSDYK